jgi:hypothetical protein
MTQPGPVCVQTIDVKMPGRIESYEVISDPEFEHDGF